MFVFVFDIGKRRSIGRAKVAWFECVFTFESAALLERHLKKALLAAATGSISLLVFSQLVDLSNSIKALLSSLQSKGCINPHHTSLFIVSKLV